jgi:hypothetical protein
MLAGRALRLMAPARQGAAAGQLLFGRAWQQGSSSAQPRGAQPWLTRTEATDASAQPGDGACTAETFSSCLLHCKFC